MMVTLEDINATYKEHKDHMKAVELEQEFDEDNHIEHDGSDFTDSDRINYIAKYRKSDELESIFHQLDESNTGGGNILAILDKAATKDPNIGTYSLTEDMLNAIDDKYLYSTLSEKELNINDVIHIVKGKANDVNIEDHDDARHNITEKVSLEPVSVSVVVPVVNKEEKQEINKDDVVNYGRIDFLESSGVIGETIYYKDKQSFDKQVSESNDVGSPLSYQVYNSQQGFKDSVKSLNMAERMAAAKETAMERSEEQKQNIDPEKDKRHNKVER